MFLITTADERTWGEPKQTIFLGTWCRVEQRRKIWSKYPDHLVPYHWDDRRKLQRDMAMLQNRLDATIPQLAETLNRLHGTSHDIPYWRLVAGPSLLLILSVVWDRLECLAAAAKAGARRTFSFADQPLFTHSFNALLTAASSSDVWNLGLYSQLLPLVPQISPEKIEIETIQLSDPPQRGMNGARALLRGIGRLCEPDIAFVDMGVKPLTLFYLQWAQGRSLHLLNSPPVPMSSLDPRLRANMKLDCGEDLFGRALTATLPQLLPGSVVEGYIATRRYGVRSLPRRARAIVTAQGQYSETFSVWAAELREKGTPIAIAQHGGHYGTDFREMLEDLEISCADRYFTWGWTRPDAKNIVPLPSPKIASVRHQMSYSPSGNLLFVFDAGHRYPNRLYATPIAGQRIRENEFWIELLNSLPPNLRARLSLRLHHVNDGYGFRELLASSGYGAFFDSSPNLARAASAARLSVIAGTSTPYLEIMAAELPMVVFQDTRFSEIRPDAEPYFLQLHDAGILLTDIPSASALLPQIWRDPAEWWGSPKVRSARENFTKRFCATDPHWPTRWKKALRELTAHKIDSAVELPHHA